MLLLGLGLLRAVFHSEHTAATPPVALPMAARPPMGWRSWNAFGLRIDQQLMLRQAAALAASGPFGTPSLASLGYGEIGVDDGWQACGLGKAGTWHSESGMPLVNKTAFPSLRRLVSQSHHLGVRVGWYVNTCWCNERERHVWPRGNPAPDAALVLDSGFDGVKIDGCGPARDMREWTRRLAGSHVVVENCANNGAVGGKGWTPARPHDVAGSQCDGFHFYRVSRDIAPQFYSTMYNLQQLRAFLGGKSDSHGVPKPPLSRPGCWAHPDMLMVGRIGPTEGRSHFGAWCITSSPLILSFDLSNADLLARVRPIITNPLALMVQQAWAGSPGQLLVESTRRFNATVWHDVDANGACGRKGRCERYAFPVWQAWSKPLNATTLALLVINLGEVSLEGGGGDASALYHSTPPPSRDATASASGLVVSVQRSLERLGWALPALTRVTDVWSQQVVSDDCKAQACVALALRQHIAPHDSVFLLVERRGLSEVDSRHGQRGRARTAKS